MRYIDFPIYIDKTNYIYKYYCLLARDDLIEQKKLNATQWPHFSLKCPNLKEFFSKYYLESISYIIITSLCTSKNDSLHLKLWSNTITYWPVIDLHSYYYYYIGNMNWYHRLRKTMNYYYDELFKDDDYVNPQVAIFVYKLITNNIYYIISIQKRLSSALTHSSHQSIRFDWFPFSAPHSLPYALLSLLVLYNIFYFLRTIFALTSSSSSSMNEESRQRKTATKTKMLNPIHWPHVDWSKSLWFIIIIHVHF